MDIICILSRSEHCGCRGEDGTCDLDQYASYASCIYRRTAEIGTPSKVPPKDNELQIARSITQEQTEGIEFVAPCHNCGYRLGSNYCIGCEEAGYSHFLKSKGM